jgi:hypothetical protein
MHSLNEQEDHYSKNDEVDAKPAIQRSFKNRKVISASCHENRCIFLVGFSRCEFRCVPRSVLCPLHRDYRKSGTSIFELQINNRDEAGEDSDVDRGTSSSAVNSSHDVDTTANGTGQKTIDEEDDDIETERFSQGSDAGSIVSIPHSGSTCGPYSHSDFLAMWRRAESIIGDDTDEIENSKMVRAANFKMNPKDTDGQLKAQYGRLLPNAMKKMMKLLELRREDVFLDIGHGLGNTCLHAAFCVGCESRGIEVVSSRHEIAEVFRGHMMNFHRENQTDNEIGKIDLRVGQLEDPKQRDFLTRGVTRAYVNNFNGVFADRSSKNGQKWFLDHYIAGLFALMAPGSIMITFHPLSLVDDRDEANARRRKHGMNESANSSFYLSEKLFLGKAYKAVKWSQRSGNKDDIYVYKYTRVDQLAGNDAVFLCSNPSCEKAINEIPISATTDNEEGRCVINHCTCGFSPKQLRARPSRGIQSQIEQYV